MLDVGPNWSDLPGEKSWQDKEQHRDGKYACTDVVEQNIVETHLFLQYNLFVHNGADQVTEGVMVV